MTGKQSKFSVQEQAANMIERGQASAAVPVDVATPAPRQVNFALPQMPTAAQVPGKRMNLGARVLPHLHESLKRYVSSLTAQGFEISQSEVLEYWLVQLQDPEYAQKLTRSLVEARDAR
jgi:hypothetical protein